MSRGTGFRITTVVYDCGHEFEFSGAPPKKNDLVICITCNKPVRVTSNDTKQWVVVCRFPGCKFIRLNGKYGQLAAEREGVRHRRRQGCGEHPVEILTPAGEMFRRYETVGQEELF